MDRKPYRVTVDFEPETGWHVAHVRLLEEPPAALSVYVGSLAYQCYDFPTAVRPLDFQSLFTVQNVSKPARAILESLQPYHRRQNPTAHPLRLIKALADADKHRVLAPSYGLGHLTFPAPIRPLKDGTELDRPRFEAGDAQAEVRVNRQPAADI